MRLDFLSDLNLNITTLSIGVKYSVRALICDLSSEAAMCTGCPKS